MAHLQSQSFIGITKQKAKRAPTNGTPRGKPTGLKQWPSSARWLRRRSCPAISRRNWPTNGWPSAVAIHAPENSVHVWVVVEPVMVSLRFQADL
jgi:hypothetical protein